MNELVSICIPLYNSIKYIQQTIDSIVTQDYPNIELVICDDCSKDGSYQFVKNYIASIQKQGLTIQLTQNEKNLGMTENWNHCIQISNGKWIKLMGGDDLLEPNCISKQIEILKDNPEIGLVICQKKVISSDGKHLFNKGHFKKSTQILGKDMVYRALNQGGGALGEPVTGLFKKEDFVKLGEYDPKIRYHADYDFWIRILLNTKYYYYLHEPLVSFRIHKGSATFQLKKSIVQDFFNMFEKYQNEEPVKKINPSLVWWKVSILTHLRDFVIKFLG